MDNTNKDLQDQDGELPRADTGNASNPTPHSDRLTDHNAVSSQLLDEQAEKYLGESANIEDLPDPQDELDAENSSKENG